MSSALLLGWPLAAAAQTGPPTGFAASNGNEQVTLTWDDPAADADIARHEYRFKTTGDYPAEWTAIEESAPDGLHEDWVVVTGLTNDVAYTFQLRAVNAGGDASTWAEAGPATPRSGVCGRTEQVRDAIVAEIAGVSDCADVTTAELADVPSLQLFSTEIKSLQPGDFSGLTALATLYLKDNELTSLPAGVFSGLTALEVLDLDINELSLLPSGVFSGLTALERLRLDINELTSLPAGVFSGLTALELLRLDFNELTSLPSGVFSGLTALERLRLEYNDLGSLPDGVFSGLTALKRLYLNENAVDPLPLAVTLERNPDAAEIRAVVLTAAPFAVPLRVSVENGGLAGGAATITVPAGARESAWVGVTRTDGTTGAVTADIDLTTQPTRPRYHGGYAFVKSASDLPLRVLRGAPTGFAASNGNEQVTLTWDAPAADADIARHEYRYKTTGDYPAEWTGIDDSAPGGLHEDWVVVTGLANDVAYTFQLRAVNAGGDASPAAEAGPATPTSGVCGRTERVRDGIVAEIAGVSDCADVTTAQLAGVTDLNLNSLRVNSKIKSLQPGDFSGLTALERLTLSFNDLSSLPDGVFSGLTALQRLFLGVNELGSLPDGVFSGLMALEWLYLNSTDLTSLPDGVFSDLTALAVLNLEFNDLTSLPDGVFSGLTALSRLHLDFNKLSSLPDGVFSGPTALANLFLDGNTEDPLPLAVTLERNPDAVEIRAVVRAAAPFAVPLSVSVENGSLAGDVSTITVPTGARESAWVGVTRTDGTTGAVTADVDLTTQPSRPSYHTGYAFVKSASDLPLRVLRGAPGAPDAPSVSAASSSSLTVMWSAPDDGGSAITDYDVRYRVGASGDWTDGSHDGTATTATLTGLASGTTYEVQVRAANDTGAGPWSPSGSSATVGQRGFAASNGNEQVTLTWNAPAEDADIARHEYRFKTTGDYPAEWTGIDDSAPGGLHEDWVVVTGLTNDVAYTFQLRTVNAAGDASTAVQAGPVTPTSGVCGRTEQVRDGIVAEIAGVSDCADVTTAQLAGVTDLDLDLDQSVNSKKIKSLQPGDFSGMTALELLHLSFNDLSSLPSGVFSGLTALQTLRLDYNDLSSLPSGVFSGLTALQTLRLNTNDLSSLPSGVFSGLTALEELQLHFNELGSLPDNVFSGLTALQTLYLPYNDLSSLPSGVFSGLTALQTLRLNTNDLSSLPSGVFSGLTALQTLRLNTNDLSSLPSGVFSGLTALEELSVSGNELSSLPDNVFSGLTALERLYLNHNEYSSPLPDNVFSGLTALEELRLNESNLSSLPSGVFSGLTALEELWLDGNAEDPLPLAVTLERNPDAAEIRAVVPSAAPFAVPLSVSVENGGLAGGATTITVPAGARESAWVGVTRTDGTTGAVTADIDLTTQPSRPSDHRGYAFVKSASDLPLTVLVVPGAPGAPAAPSVSAASSSSLTVMWTAPDDGDSAITDYDVRYRPGASGDWTDGSHDGTAITATLTGLASGTTHEVQVRAANDAGPGFWSPSGSGATDGQAVPAPQGFAASNGNEQVTLTWTAAPDADIARHEYRFKTTGDYPAEWTGIDDSAPGGLHEDWVVVTGLANDVAYTFQLRAVNAGGDASTWAEAGPATPTSGVCGRTEQVREAIMNQTHSWEDCADVTTAQLARMGFLLLDATGIKSLQPGDFSGLTALQALRLNANDLSSLPDNVFSGLTALERLYVSGNELSSLPDNVFSGLTALELLYLNGNAEDPLPLAVTLERNPDAAEIRAVVPSAAPFAVPLSVSVENGGLAGDVSTITVPAGARESAWVGVTRTDGTTGAVTADIDLTTQPSLPRNHIGYAFVKSASDLPLTVEPATDPVWSATMTAGETQVGHGYDATATPAVGTLDDDDFEYGSLPYSVLAVVVGPSVVRFGVAGGLSKDEPLTLEFGGHAFAFSDRIPAIRVSPNFYWSVPAALDDLETEFPVGATATVCLRTDTQVCPLGRIVFNKPPAFSSSAAFDAAENQRAAGTVVAADSDAGDDVTGYAITGGADQSFFSIGATSGALTFDAAPNFEDAKDVESVDPANAAGNNQYVVEVTATSGAGEREKTATQTITVTVTDVGGEAPGKPGAPTVTAASVSSLSVSWAAPANAGPAITDYDYRHRTTSPEGTWTEVTGTTITTLSATIGGLAENTSYDVQVRATNDEGTGSWSDAGSGATDANAAPAFSSPAAFDAAENQAAAGMVVAADSDADDDVTGYAITGGADRNLFSIGATSGALTFDAAPNFEDAKDVESVDPANAAGNNQYVVEVTATSGAGEREKTATQTITVTVTDVDTEAPGKPGAPTVTAASVTSLSVSWAAPANAGPAITDYDVQYREGNSGGWSDAGHSGTAVTATLTGLSENTSYDVQVRATNDEGTGSWSDAGSGATDANAAPAFSSPAAFDAAENQAAAGMVVAADSDADDDVTGYAITGGADQSFFSIGATSGALTFDAAPNFEDAKDVESVDPANAAGNNQYVVEVTATSGAGEREKTATQTITVTVTDVDTEAPGKPAAPTVTAASVSSLSVSWAAPANAGPAITDYDVQYREGNSGGWTDAGHTGTAVTATLTGLSENTSYQVQVRATNAEGTGAWSDAGSGTTDANAAPAFTSSATFDAAENQTEVAMVMAADSDSEDKIERYDITGGADQSFFLVIASSGHLEFRVAPNFEAPSDQGNNNTYVVEVTATSGAGERVKTATQTVTVTVTDVGGEAPGKPGAPSVSAASVTSLSVSWSAPDNAGPAITDYDVQYRAGTSGGWTDAGHTGTAVSATITGLSENTSYQVQVRATNDEGTGSWSDAGSGTTDANAAPAFSSSAAFDAAENQRAAGTVLATDSDAGDDVTGYAITGGPDQAFFSVGATSGALTFKSAPNFEAPSDQGANNTYVVEVTATSGAGERVKTATQTVTVTVTDVGGEAPGKPGAPSVSAASVTSLSVSWSAPDNAGPAITDYDVQYREGNSGGWTNGNYNGTATTATITGLSENTSYQVQVRATNAEGTGSWSDAGSGATDANAAPAFSSSAAFDAAENQRAAGTVLATDSDAGDDVTGYAITGGPDQAFFSVGATSGALTFKSAPNFEAPSDQGANNTYVVEVTATSGAGERVKTATQTVTVTVTDVGGEAPGKPGAPSVSAASVTSLSVSWSAPDNAGPAITDYDVQYREGNSGGWTDAGHTGTAVTATLTGLSENTSYQVQVRATNAEGTGAWSDAGSGTTDANAAPAFTSSATFDAAENQTEVAMVMAADSDSEDKIERYDITGGADQSFFLVIASSGHLEFRVAPNFEAPSDQGNNNTYVVEVTATSGAGERVKTATQTVTVTVTDVSGEAPGKPGAPSVSAASATSLSVSWSAPDNAGPAISDYDVQYRAGTSGGWTDAGHTGTAVSATITGLSENTSYQVQVRATNDEGTGSWSDAGSGTTVVADNASPSFSSPAAFTAAENQTTAGTVLATDSDAGDDITGYAITGGADGSAFSIGATTGALTFKAAPDYEEPHDQGSNNTYVVVVTATSGTGTRVKSATQTITVTVTDVADDAPPELSPPEQPAPAAPDAPAVSSSSSSLTVSWSVPDNYGSPITDYDYRYRTTSPLGAWIEVTGTTITTLTVTIEGLPENTSYQVQVRATNAEGIGEWSDAGSGRTSGGPSVGGICDRTPRVRDRIVVLLKYRHSYKGDCSEVTETHLVRLVSLDLGRNPSTEDEFTMALRQGDFAGLSNLERLFMRDAGLESLPAGVFDGLGSLVELELNKNRLTSLPAGVFSGLDSLETLKLHHNPSLGSLPYDEFEALPALTELLVDRQGHRKLQVAGSETDTSRQVVAGGSVTYQVRLMATTNAKAGNPVQVTVTVSSDQGTETLATLSFTRENWFKHQTVTVDATGWASGTTVTLTHAAAGAHYAYDQWPLPEVTVTVL